MSLSNTQSEFSKCTMIRCFLLANIGDALMENKKVDLNNMVGFMLEDISEVDVTQLTEHEMNQLGFVQYDPKCGFYLIPSWLFPFLKNGVDYYDAKASTVVTSTNYMRGESTYGLLTYGAKPVDSVDVPERKMVSVDKELS